MPVALPPAKDAKLDSSPDALSAYDICLALEKNATTDDNRMRARILGYLILHAPTSAALAEVVGVIHSYCQDENALLELAGYFRLWLILPFKKFKGRTPTPSDHPSRPSFDRLKEDLKKCVSEAPKDHRGAKVQALIRDCYKCVVTGIYDQIAREESLVGDVLVAAAGGGLHTELAHILPESTYFNVSDTSTSESQKKDYSASVLAVLERFGYNAEMVNGPKVHSLQNVITMQKDVHDGFDRLEIWLESTGVADCYRVQTKFQHPMIRHDSQVTFTSPDPINLPCPSQQLLMLHATCAKVAHLSGAGEYIDKFDRDVEDSDVLATDGTRLPTTVRNLERILDEARLPFHEPPPPMPATKFESGQTP